MIYSSKVIFKNAPYHVQVLITTHHNFPDIEVVFNFFRWLMCGATNFIIDFAHSPFSSPLHVHFHRSCENQFVNHHLYQCRVLFQLCFFIYPIPPLKDAVTSTNILTLFLLDFLEAPQNWGREVLRHLHLLYFWTAYPMVLVKISITFETNIKSITNNFISFISLTTTT